jgi:RimJ/RimL family protein N-acetyltransferase/N-acetylglutamate synthase-like GNAT family acetyltransferase
MLKNNCLLPLKYKNISLRPMRESDIKDDESWFTVETEWCDWDAPWEGDISTEEADERIKWRMKRIQQITDNPPEFYSHLEIDTEDGRHVGWVNCYTIDIDEVIAVGLDIPPIDARRKGCGRNALLLYIAYVFTHKEVDEIYTQTWSGNLPMIKMAESIGFAEIGRIKGIRRVKGERYDALTFSMTRGDFFERYTHINLINIRKYKESDYNVFKEMIGECFNNDYKIPLTEKQLDKLSGEMTQSVKSDIQYLDLLILNGTVKGFIIYQVDTLKSDWCEKEGCGCIRELFIATDVRGKGYGLKLVIHAEMKLNELCVPYIYLTTDDSKDFWIRAGYRDTGEICDKNGGSIVCKVNNIKG